MKSVFLLAIFITINFVTLAQEDNSDLTVDLTIRPRAEFRNGSFTLKEPEDNPAFFVSQRTRIRIQFGISKLKVGVAAQNVRIWGQSGQIAPEEGNNTSLNEVWAEYEFIKGLSLKLGRQPLVYDDERILGALNWNQLGRWHDLALFKYESRRHKLHVGLAYNQDRENKLNNYYSSPGDNYKTMQKLWYENTINDNFKVSLVFLNTGFQVQSDSSMTNMQTFGGNFYKTGGPLTFTGTFYYQTGTNITRQSVKAFLASVYGNYKIDNSFSIQAGTDYLSGRDMGETDSLKTTEFNPLYGTHHGFYGIMDYFYVGVPHSNVGLWDTYAGVSYLAFQDFLLRLTGHVFNAAAKVVDVEEKGSYLGTELDLFFTWNLIKGVKLYGGYSQMFAGESMEIVKGRGDHTLNHNWIWAMFVVDVRIFDLKR